MWFRVVSTESTERVSREKTQGSRRLAVSRVEVEVVNYTNRGFSIVADWQEYDLRSA